jgi:YhcH/YjgK/YiaL family protein
MILDQLKNAHLYYLLGERIRKGLDYLKNTDFSNLEPGTVEIDGEDVFAMISNYDTKPITSGKWEAHKKYIDIQYIVDGKEKIGYSFSNKMIVTEEYKEPKDIMFYKGEGNFITIEAGYFVILMPTDIHMPGIAINISTQVKKVVVKVKVDMPPEAIKVDEPTETTKDELDSPNE